MRKLIALSALLLLGARVGLAASGPELLKAEADLRGEISIRPVDRPLPAPGSETSLRLHFEAKNTTDRLVYLPEIEMRVSGADGILKEYFGIQLTSSLAAGETRRFFVHTDSIVVRHDDTIVLVPVRPPERVEKSGATAKVRALNGMPPEVIPKKLTAAQCEDTCAEKDELCAAHCSCGVKLFSFTCGATGGYNYGCECLSGCPGGPL